MQAASLVGTSFQFPGQTSFTKSADKDIYIIEDRWKVVIYTDRTFGPANETLSAVAGKGQVSNEIASRYLKSSIDVCPLWYINTPDPNVVVGRLCEPLGLSIKVFSCLSGEARALYQANHGKVGDQDLPKGLKENAELSAPLVLVMRKKEGKEEPYSFKEAVKKNILSEKEAGEVRRNCIDMFKRGLEMASEQGLILAETKYKLGRQGHLIYLTEEVHTPALSRYFYVSDYEERQADGKPQPQINSSFIWNGNGSATENMGDPRHIMEKYNTLFELLMGRKFRPAETENIFDRIEQNVNRELRRLALQQS